MRTYDIGGHWGDAINWFPSYESMRVVGWKEWPPTKGDRLRVPMRSGKTLVCEFTSVERRYDVPDMFFASVKPLGYQGEFRKSRWSWLRTIVGKLPEVL